MANPTVVNVQPAPNSTDVVLGSSITVTFSEAINTDSFNNSTFVLTGPNRSSIVSSDQLVELNPTPSQGTGYILGTFGFSTKSYNPWIAFKIYHVGDQVVDSNGNVQTVTGAGTSAPYAPAWNTTLGNSTTDNNIPAWQANFPYIVGNYILDPNGNIQKATTVIGVSGPGLPVFNTILSGTTFDGGVTWTNFGALSAIVWVNGGLANSGQTIATFTPSQPLLPGITYTVLIVGANSVLVNNFVQDLAGNKLLTSYQWSFTTGTLNISVPPIQNPTRSLQTSINTEQIQIIPRAAVGNDISVVDIIFPAPIDTTTFDPASILIGIEPIMNDPDVMVPAGVSATYIVQGNKLIVTVTGL